MASFSSIKSKIFDREERKQQYQAHIRGLNAYDRHKKFLNDYVRFYGGEKSSQLKLPQKTDQDTLREGYRFIRTEEDDKDRSWEQRLVKRYYDKLFKEYCIADMSHYKIGKIGLRWRTEKEVISGKGQFVCGNKHCNERDGLASYEVNFSYVEAGENKQALVKLVTCERCAEKLHYRRLKEKELLERREKEDYRRKRDLSISDHDTDEEYEERKDRRKVSEQRGNEEQKRKRERSRSDDDDTDEEHERRKGSERIEKEVHKRKRERSRSDDAEVERERRKVSGRREKEEHRRNRDTNEVHEGSKERGKGKQTSGNHVDNDDNFDEFLEGMFP